MIAEVLPLIVVEPELIRHTAELRHRAQVDGHARGESIGIVWVAPGVVKAVHGVVLHWIELPFAGSRRDLLPCIGVGIAVIFQYREPRIAHALYPAGRRVRPVVGLYALVGDGVFICGDHIRDLGFAQLLGILVQLCLTEKPLCHLPRHIRRDDLRAHPKDRHRRGNGVCVIVMDADFDQAVTGGELNVYGSHGPGVSNRSRYLC